MATGFTPEYNSTLMDSDSPFTAIGVTEIPVQGGVPGMATVQTGIVFLAFKLRRIRRGLNPLSLQAGLPP